MRYVCGKCLRLWSAERVENRSVCPFCGGALHQR
jgi:DNA-directed RNA polymerase subunit RPC12/RpoP